MIERITYRCRTYGMLLSLVTSISLQSGCGSSDVECGPGTTKSKSACLPSYEEVVCGQGTHIDATGACVPSYDEVVCGPGTHIDANGACVPSYDEVVCGPGTHVNASGACVIDGTACGIGTVLIDKKCVPSEETCGSGTVFLDGQCVFVTPTECGPGTTFYDGVCSPNVVVYTPLAYGDSAVVAQGSHGHFSHTGHEVYSFDYAVSEGTPVHAARAGRVVATRKDSDTGCDDSSCANDANFIMIDHGDGTFGNYWHLMKGGALVNPGDMVCRGQKIGMSGNTGFSTGPHLHFSVVDLWHYSLPVYFVDLSDSDGMPVPGAKVTSGNSLDSGCADIAYSNCLAKTYLPRGVIFDNPPPCAVFTPDKDYVVTGYVVGEGGSSKFSYVEFARPNSEGTWQYTCTKLDSDGRFSVTLNWPATGWYTNSSGAYSFMMWSAASSHSTYKCMSAGGWDSSPRVYIRDH